MFELRNVQFMYNKESCIFLKTTSTSNYRQFMEYESTLGKEDVSSVYLKGKDIVIRICQRTPLSIELEDKGMYNITVKHIEDEANDNTTTRDVYYYGVRRIEIADDDVDIITDDDNAEEDDDSRLLDEYEVRQLFNNLVETIREKLYKKREKVNSVDEWLNNLDATVENIEVLDTFNKKFEKDF